MLHKGRMVAKISQLWRVLSFYSLILDQRGGKRREYLWKQCRVGLRSNQGWEKREKNYIAHHLKKKSAIVYGHQPTVSNWIHTAKKVKGRVLATNVLNFLLCYKLNFWFSPKPHLDITPFFLPLSTSCTKAELSAFILHQTLSLSLDISLTVGSIFIPYLPKAVISVLIFPGLSATPWMGGLPSFSLVFAPPSQRSIFRPISFVIPYTTVGSNIQHHSLSFLFSLYCVH